MKKVRDAVPARNDHIVALEELESMISPGSLAPWSSEKGTQVLQILSKQNGEVRIIQP